MSKNVKIKDVEFAFFSQLSYFNWNELDPKDSKGFTNLDTYKNGKFMEFLTDDKIWPKIKTKWYDKEENSPKTIDGILMYDEEDKRLFGVYGTELGEGEYGKEVIPTYNFDGWQFIYSADKTKLYKDTHGIENVIDDGFFATAFVKGNDILVSYRGTEFGLRTIVGDLFIDDGLTDIKIGLGVGDSQLTCSYLFLKHVKKLFSNKGAKTIYITGHSLGGGLAQYAYLSNERNNKTVTWNALGVKRYVDEITKNKSKLEREVERLKAKNENVLEYIAMTLYSTAIKLIKTVESFLFLDYIGEKALEVI